MAKKQMTDMPADDIARADLGEGGANVEAEIDPRDAELEKLRAENAALKSGLPAFTPDKRHKVSVLHGPSWVVEAQNGEHPIEAFKRATGVLSSQNEFVCIETEEPLGRAA